MIIDKTVAFFLQRSIELAHQALHLLCFSKQESQIACSDALEVQRLLHEKLINHS